MEKITTPILLVGFNRPHCIRKVMQQLESVQPAIVYFSIDAPREGRNGEKELVEQVKSIVKNVSWNCETHYRFFEKNVGAEVNVSSGVSWVLENYDSVIVNEDDIYGGYAFYKFIQDMLIHYKDDQRIGIVSGLNLVPEPNDSRDDYYIARTGHIWGWGTWKRVWDNYRLKDEIKAENLSDEKLSVYCANKDIAVSTRRTLIEQSKNGVGRVTWDYMFWYHRILHNYFAIIPNKSLITNIGVEGLHAKGFSVFHFTPYVKDFSISAFHDFIWNKEYDIKSHNAREKKGRVQRFMKKAHDKLKIIILRRFKYTDKYLNNFFNS